MNMEVFCINRKGRSHTRLEDAIYRNDDDFVYGVFDGVSASKYGAEAANALAEDMGRCFHDPSFRKAVLTYPVQDVRKGIVEAIAQSSKRVLKKYGCEIKDAACTMVLCVLDPETKMATILHCGDGAAFAISDTYQYSTATVLSYPDNSGSGAVYPAQDISQLARMRVTRVSLESLRGILICTDGFSSAYLNPMRAIFDSYGLPRVFKCSSVAELDELVDEVHIKENGIGDDISAIMLKLDNNIDYSDLKDEARQIANDQKNSDNEDADEIKEPAQNAEVQKDSSSSIPISEDESVPVLSDDEKKSDSFSDVQGNSVEAKAEAVPDRKDDEYTALRRQVEENNEGITDNQCCNINSKALSANHAVTVILAIVVIASLVLGYMLFSGYQKEKSKNSETISNLQSSVSALVEENEKLSSRIETLENEAGITERTTEAIESTTENDSEDKQSYGAEITENNSEQSTDTNENEG